MTGKRTQIQPSDTTNMSQSETDAVNILFATNNAHKLMEVQAVLGPGFRLVTPRECGVTEEIPEEQQTLEGNASQKAHYLNDRTGLDCFADDTGLEVKALGGAPGVHSARYATDGHDFAANNRLLLKNLEGATDRRAQFRTVISLILNGEEHLFEGVVEGRIIDREEGSGTIRCSYPTDTTRPSPRCPPKRKTRFRTAPAPYANSRPICIPPGNRASLRHTGAARKNARLLLHATLSIFALQWKRELTTKRNVSTPGPSRR